MIDRLLDHWAEVGVTASGSWLAYVTQFPYHVRRRHKERVRTVTIICAQRIGHHVRWVMWQVTVIIPPAVRRPWWRRRQE